MKKDPPIKITIKDLNEALQTSNTKIILAVLREYAASRKKGPLHLKENFRVIEFMAAINNLGLILRIVPNENAKKVWK